MRVGYALACAVSLIGSRAAAATVTIADSQSIAPKDGDPAAGEAQSTVVAPGLKSQCVGGRVLVSDDTDGTTGFFSCKAPGTKTAGQSCAQNNDADCVADHVCLPTNVTMGTGAPICWQLCDNAHACPNGKTCKALPLAANISLCM